MKKHAWETLAQSVVVRRFDDQREYGAWLSIQNIEVPCWVGNMIADEIIENDADQGMVERGGCRYRWKRS